MFEAALNSLRQVAKGNSGAERHRERHRSGTNRTRTSGKKPFGQRMDSALRAAEQQDISERLDELDGV